MARPRLYHVIDGKKECSQCHISKPLDAFGKRTAASDGHQPECKECHRGRYTPIYPRDESILEKACSDCGDTKSSSEFYDDPSVKSGIRGACKKCIDTRNDDWEKSNPDKRKAIANKWFKKAWEDPDKRPVFKERVAAWRSENPERVKQHRDTDWEKNADKPERVASRKRGTQRFFQERPGYRAAASHKRRALIRQSMIVDAMINVWVLYERNHGICTLCNEPVYRETKWPDQRIATIDHCVPSTLGGEHSYANTKLAHHYCNGIKNNRLETPEILAECRRRFLKRYRVEQLPEETATLPQGQLQLL
jgi:hypothetical protein